MIATLLLDPDLSKLAPFVYGGCLLILVLPVLFIWTIVKAFSSEGAAQRRAIVGLVLVLGALLLGRPLMMLALAFLPH
jgi:hypothetical protein